jgi:hypothetical protein
MSEIKICRGTKFWLVITPLVSLHDGARGTVSSALQLHDFTLINNSLLPRNSHTFLFCDSSRRFGQRLKPIFPFRLKFDFSQLSLPMKLICLSLIL